MPTVASRKQDTLLHAILRHRRLSREQTVKVLYGRAHEMKVEDFALSLRQLDRYLAGDIESLPRPSTCRVAEAEFGWPMEYLLSPFEGDVTALVPAGPGMAPPDGRDLREEELVAWLADHSASDFAELWKAVADGAACIKSQPRRVKAALDHRRGAVTRSDIATAIEAYYEAADQLYRVRVGPHNLLLSLLTRPEWLHLSLPIGRGAENVRVVTEQDDPFRMTAVGLHAAVERLAAAEAAETVMVNDSLYRLLEIDIKPDHLTSVLSLVDFARYALTADLLEEELVDSITTGTTRLPLRDLYLPNTVAAYDLNSRLCVGGPVCLTAIARPEGDYALLVQQRSKRVLNFTGRLAVIPKAFHQPIVDSVAEARISTTVERELEEELLGRLDLDQAAAGALRHASPYHPSNLSEPMAWLQSNKGAWRLECTGFAVNLVTGTYEFGCLIVIEDPIWWERYGHRVETNWEAARLRSWSSRDTDGLARLTTDPKWSNEGLFAFVEGLRRLAQLDENRVAAPTIES